MLDADQTRAAWPVLSFEVCLRALPGFPETAVCFLRRQFCHT
jgi:hypothetical protein